MRNVKIKRVMNGFVVDVGCQTLVFEGAETLLSELKRYLDSPDATEREYIAIHGLANADSGAIVMPTSYASTTPAPNVGCSSGN